MARRVRGVIERDPMEKIGFDVYEHEVPILQAMHGPARIKVFSKHPDYDKGQMFHDDGREIDPSQEFNRLARRYGDNPDAKAPWVQYVYGLELSGQFAAAIGGRERIGRRAPMTHDAEAA